jgi:hypothetical protein
MQAKDVLDLLTKDNLKDLVIQLGHASEYRKKFLILKGR